MIELVQTKKSKTGIKWNGNYICSSVDPEAEAQKWVDKNKTRIMRQKNIFVLGVGCGYHLVALQKNFPGMNVLAVDTKSEFIEFARREHALELSDIVFVQADGTESFKASQRIHQFLHKRYAVLSFAPAFQEARDKYAHFEELLVGRTEPGILFLKQVRSGYNPLTLAQSSLAGDDPAQLMSIKTLDKAIDANTPADLILKIKILKEIIN